MEQFKPTIHIIPSGWNEDPEAPEGGNPLLTSLFLVPGNFLEAHLFDDPSLFIRPYVQTSPAQGYPRIPTPWYLPLQKEAAAKRRDRCPIPDLFMSWQEKRKMKRLKELRKRFGSSLGSLGNETLHPFYSRKHVVQTCKVRKSVPHSDRYLFFHPKKYFFQ